MINSLSLNRHDLTILTEWECVYVMKLKNDIDVFKAYLRQTANCVNCNEAMVAILDRNSDFQFTKLFKEFRTKTINRYVDKLRSGKIKISGDNCTLVSNPLCYLKASMGQYDENDLELQGNQVYTKLFPDDEDLIMFRSPHVSQSNVYIGKNTHVEDIDKYFSFGENIIVVNSIRNPICQILSGCDFDSDFCLVSNDKVLVDAGWKCYGKYKICENGIKRDKNRYRLNCESLAKIDNQLAHSKFNIGRIVNLGQLAMSMYNDLRMQQVDDKPEQIQIKKNNLKKLQDIIEIMNILSGVTIDSAKKSFDINIEDEIRHIERELKKISHDIGKEGKKPLFWQYVSKNDNIRTKNGRAEKLIKYNTSMDYLQDVLKWQIKDADSVKKEEVKLQDLLINGINANDANRKQEAAAIKAVSELNTFIGSRLQGCEDDKEKQNEAFREIDNELDKITNKFKRTTLKQETMYDLILKIARIGQNAKVGKITKIKCRLIAFLYAESRKTLLSIFRSNNSQN